MLIPVRFHAVEEISSLYEFSVDAVSHDSEISFEAIVGKPATITLSHEHEVQRHFTGVVCSFAQGGTYASTLGELIVYRLTIVPWFWLLTLDSDCRVFEEKTIKDVVEDVFKRRASDQEFSFDLTATYAAKPYCVQYRERDFDFASRLLEQEGIAYCFEHGEKSHKLVAFDDSSARPDCKGESELVYTSAEKTERDQNEVSEWTVEQKVPPGRYALTGHDFTSPSDDNLASAASTIKIGGNANREIFDYPPYYTSKDGDRYATVRMEELETASYRIRGSGAYMPLVPGTHVKLDGHYRKEFNGKRYLLTRVEHELEQSPGNEGATSYSNSFYCLPADIKYRPQVRTIKPTVRGSQTARVVGPGGEEIHCDEYGRIRIQFPWDRHGAADGSNVCWARTSQSLAGPAWGGIYTPRIGQEVVVTFIEGDPDRPLVTGVVYNGDNSAPYALPGNKTQSGIKTRSTKEGSPDNYNEIRFEDKLGNEMFTIQAEKDLERLVKNDETDEVGHDRTRNVGNDESVTIGNDRTVSVVKNHSESVGENETLDVGEDRSRNVGANETVAVKTDQKISVGKKRSIDVGDSQTLSIEKDHTETVGADHSISVTKNYGLNAKKITIVAEDEISIKVGSAQITMKKSGDVSIKGKKINVKGSGDVVIKGSKTLVN